MAENGPRITPWESLSIQDNWLFQKVMQDKQLCKELIEKLLSISIVDITYPEGEKTIDNSPGAKGVRLDVFVKDDTGKIYDIEMQVSKGKELELQKRIRYYQSMIDINELYKGSDYTELNDTFVIFICTFDLFGQNRRLYTFKNYCEQDKALALSDGAVKLFLNSKGFKGIVDPDIKCFLRYVNGEKPEGDFTKRISEEVKRLKQHDELRLEYMTYGEKLREEYNAGKAEGLAEGKAEGLSLVNLLNQRLFGDKRLADVEKAASDQVYQNKLLEEYGLI